MKRIRPAPMGRAYRYQRRMAHIEIRLAERNAPAEGTATVVGEESAPAKSRVKAKPARGKTAGNPRAQAAKNKSKNKSKAPAKKK